MQELVGYHQFPVIFYECFNKSIASAWMKKRNEYIIYMAAVKGNLSKKSSVMNYLKELVIKIKGNTYKVTNIKEKLSWTDLKTARHFKSIVICFEAFYVSRAPLQWQRKLARMISQYVLGGLHEQKM